ncbi:hypothetical protein KEM48_008376 [Puccinia striiformis f. sp. tritici PST-130]|nr:hypothetical protein KEM48_008376 [Puccinia striiformis f. sp. tritici PST-130]
MFSTLRGKKRYIKTTKYLRFSPSISHIPSTSKKETDRPQSHHPTVQLSKCNSSTSPSSPSWPPSPPPPPLLIPFTSSSVAKTAETFSQRASEAQSSAKLIVAARDRSRDVTCGLAQVLAPALWFADNKAAAVSSSNCTRTYDIMERARTRSWIYFSDLLR